MRYVDDHGIREMKLHEVRHIETPSRREATLAQQSVLRWWREHGRPGSRLKTSITDCRLTIQRVPVLDLQDSPRWDVGVSIWQQCKDRTSIQALKARLNTIAKATNKPYRFRVRLYDDGAFFLKELKWIIAQRKRSNGESYRLAVELIRELQPGQQRIIVGVSGEILERVRCNLRDTVRFKMRVCGIGNYRVTRVS